MTPRLYRVSIPCRVLVLAFDEDAAANFITEDFDAQVDNMVQDELTVTKITSVNITSKERDAYPYFAEGVKEKIVRASHWLTVIAVEEEAERRKQDDFNRRQLRLPGVD
jgi:hypothetical protein